MVTETIEPALKQVQRELVLVVDYQLGMPISVLLSRKTNITQLIEAKRFKAIHNGLNKSFPPLANRDRSCMARLYFRENQDGRKLQKVAGNGVELKPFFSHGFSQNEKSAT